MSSFSLQNEFSQRSDKVVSLRELANRAYGNYHSYLSVLEIVYLHTWDDLRSAFLGLKGQIMLERQGIKNDGIYKKPGFPELYYTKEAIINHLKAESEREFNTVSGTRAKIHALFMKAWDECEDHTPKVQSKTLKPKRH